MANSEATCLLATAAASFAAVNRSGVHNWYPGPFMPFDFHRNCKAKLESGRWSILSSSRGGASIPDANASLKVSMLYAQNSNSDRRCNSYAQVCNQAAAAKCRMCGLEQSCCRRELQGSSRGKHHGAPDPMTSTRHCLTFSRAHGSAIHVQEVAPQAKSSPAKCSDCPL
jgi:hypothetical protein